MNDIESIKPVTIALAEHFQKQGKPIPPEEELIDQAKNLLNFFEVLIEGDVNNC